MATIWEMITPRPAETPKPNMEGRYFGHYRHESLELDQTSWISTFASIQHEMKLYGYMAPTFAFFLENTQSKIHNYSPAQQWNHEMAHINFAIENQIHANLYLSNLSSDPTIMTPWVALDIHDLSKVHNLKEFLGNFLDAPGKINLGYAKEQEVANYLLGHS